MLIREFANSYSDNENSVQLRVLRGDESKGFLLDIAFISSTEKCIVGYNALRCRPCSKVFDAMQLSNLV